MSRRIYGRHRRVVHHLMGWIFFFSFFLFSLFFFEGFFYCRPAQLHLPAWRAISDASATRGRRRNYEKWWQNLPNGKKKLPSKTQPLIVAFFVSSSVAYK